MNPDPDSTRHAGSSAEDPEFIERLAQGLHQQEQGERPDLVALSEGRPDLMSKLEAALGEADALAGLHRAASGFDPRIGERIDNRYELRDRLGSGGMGVVYEAFDLELRRTVALKMMRPEFATGDELEARFEREAEVLASIEHPAIVAVHDRGRTPDGQAFLVMARLRGQSASELIDSPPEASPSNPAVASTEWLSGRLESVEPNPELELDDNYVRQVVRWVARIARALHTVHRAGIIHRDVKPSNVFVQADGSPVLIDFGLVTLSSEATVALREAAIGTPAYMAPEQIDPRHSLTPQTDVYGLTATLYHFLTFDRPYQGSPSQILAALQRSDPTPANKLRPGLPRDMQAILETGMARKLEQRYATAAELADDLEAWLDYRPVKARPISAVGRVWRQWRRTTTFRAAVAGVVIAAVALGVKSVRDQMAEVREQQRLAAFSGIHPVTMTGMPGLRVSPDPEADQAMAAAVDKFVEFSDDPCPARVIRAAFYLDRGKRDLAAAEMIAVADYHNAPLARVVATRIATAKDNSIEVADLSPSDNFADRLVLAYFLGRGKIADDDRVIELLADCDELVAAELLINARIGKTFGIRSTDLQRTELREILNDCNRLGGIRGFSSAFLEKAKGTVQTKLTHYREAKSQFERARDLAEHDYTIWHNLALNQMRVDADEMRSSLRKSLALQPASMRLHNLQLVVELNAQDFDAADRCLDEVPYPPGAAGRRMRLEFEGRIWLARSKSHLDSAKVSAQQRAESRECARKAFACYRDSRPPGDKEPTLEMLVAKCFAEPEAGYKFQIVDFVNARDPLNPDYLERVLLLFPKDETNKNLMALRSLIESIYQVIAPAKFAKTKKK